MKKVSVSKKAKEKPKKPSTKVVSQGPILGPAAKKGCKTIEKQTMKNGDATFLVDSKRTPAQIKTKLNEICTKAIENLLLRLSEEELTDMTDEKSQQDCTKQLGMFEFL